MYPEIQTLESPPASTIHIFQPPKVDLFLRFSCSIYIRKFQLHASKKSLKTARLSFRNGRKEFLGSMEGGKLCRSKSVDSRNHFWICILSNWQKVFIFFSIIRPRVTMLSLPLNQQFNDQLPIHLIINRIQQAIDVHINFTPPVIRCSEPDLFT